MNQHYLAGNPPLEINLRRSKRARRISLRVSSLDGKVTLTFPYGLPESQALEFANEKADWLRKQQDRQVETVLVALGVTLPFRGSHRVIVSGSGRRIEISDTAIYVPGNPETAARRVLGHLKQSARSELALASDTYAAKLGKPYSRLSIRDTRTRWGSCSSNGGLMYSWRLIMAPPNVLDYVAAHEVAHLVEMNHSSEFWKKVEQIYGDYSKPRQWLRDHGNELHRFRFDD